MKRSIIILLVLVVAVSLALPVSLPKVRAAGGGAVVYGIDRNYGQVWEIDVANGSAVKLFTVKSLPLDKATPNGLAFDDTSGRWYYATYSGQAKLYFWDGADQYYAGLLTGEIACGDFYDGKYYYIAGGPAGATDDLYEVTFDASGLVVSTQKIADISNNTHKWTFNGDIAISPDAVIYGVGACGSHSAKYEFFKVNLDSTGFKLIDPSIFNYSLQLAFGSDGTLYGHESRNTGPFYAIDLETGDMSAAYAITGGNLYTDCASGPRDTSLTVNIDIKPSSCPNPLNIGSNGVISVAIVGTTDFNVTQIDPETVGFYWAGTVPCDDLIPINVQPLRWSYEDAATPWERTPGEPPCLDCSTAGRDGTLDLVLKFDKDEIVTALETALLQGLEDGACVELALGGNLFAEFGGTAFTGSDFMKIINQNNPPGSASAASNNGGKKK